MFMNRIAAILLTGIVLTVPVLSGCTGSYRAAMAEYKELGISQMEEGDYAGAAASFQDALDESVGTLGAEEIDISYYKALALYLAGDVDAALDTYTALIDFDPDNWEVYYLRGNVYLKEERESEALEDYAQAVDLNGDSPQLCLNICYNLVTSGLQESAQPYLDEALKAEPESGEDYLYLGTICYLTGDYDNGKDYLTRAQEMGEDGAYAWLGEIALSDGNYEEAISCLTQAAETADETQLGTVVTGLVTAYEYTGDFERAYETAAAYLDDHSDEALEREYVFLATRVGALPEVMEADTKDPEDAAAEEESEASSSDETDGNEASEEENMSTLDDPAGE